MLRVILLASLLSSSSALAQSEPLAAGDAAWAEGDLTRAVDGYEGALRTGQLSGAPLARALRMLGLLRSILDQTEAATRAFARSLAIDPEQSAPEELPPEKLVAFQQARAANEGAMRLSLASDDSRVSVALTRAPEGWVDSLVLRASPPGADPWESTFDGASTSLEVDAAAWRGAEVIDVEVVARDSFGNTLARGETRLTRRPATSNALPLEEEEESSSIASSPWLWVGIGAVVVGGVLAAILLTRDTEYQLGEPTFSMSM